MSDLPPAETGETLRRRDQLARVVGLARSGQSAMTVGLLVNGLASYVFLAAAGRALGPSGFAPVSVLWAVLYLVGSGLFQPFEQELGRSIAARRARGIGFGSLVERSVALAAGLFGLVALAATAAAAPLADALFRGDESFVAALVASIAGVGTMLVVRGLLAGSSRYFGYAVLFLADALTKSIPAIALALAGVEQPLAFAAVIAVSGFVGAAAPMTRGRRLGEAGPPPEWSPLLSSLGFLLLTSFLSAITLNIGTVAVEILATDAEADRAGVFLSGLVIARVPLFLFQAVQAILLPRLSRLAAAGDMRGFHDDVRRLMLAMAGLTTLAVAGSAALGPIAVELLFGSDFALLSSRDMGLLTLASMLMMCALSINQAQLALRHQHQTGWPWGLASLVFAVITAWSSDDLLLRVEWGMVAAGCTVTLTAGLLLASELRHPDEAIEPTVAL